MPRPSSPKGGKSTIESALAPWIAERPDFLWIPTNPRTILLDRISGAIGEAKNGAVPSVAGPTNYVGNSLRHLEFNVPASYPNGLLMMVLLSVEDPTAMTGCFIKVGNDSYGLGLGAGNTTFEDTGSKRIGLIEGVAWRAGASSAFTKGLNVAALFVGNNNAQLNTATNFEGEGTSGSWTASSNQIRVGGYVTNRGANARVLAAAVYGQSRTNEAWATWYDSRVIEVRELLQTPHADVERLFRARSRRVWAVSPVSGGAALAGNAQAVASASGALSASTPVALAGAAVGVVTSTGAISSAMPLSGAAAAVAAASGNLGSGILLAGGAQAQAGASGNITFGAALAAAVASGVLGTQKPLAGGAQAAVAATGNLQASSPSSLAGDAQAAAAATGQMQVQFSISGAALMEALATGGITVTGSTALAGPAQAAAQSTGALTTTIPLAGAAQMVASATGTLALGRPLAGAAVAVSVAGGLLTITTNLAGAAVAQAIASGYMALQIPISGAALAQAIAHGVLSGISASLDTPKIRLLRVPAETRRIGHRIR